MANQSASLKSVRNIKIHLQDRVTTPNELLEHLLKNKDNARKITGGVTKIEADKRVINWLQTLPFGKFVKDDGEVDTLAMTGFEEALIIIAVVGTLSGLAVGYLKGYEDGQKAAEGEEEGSNGGDSGEDTADTGGDDDADK